MKNRLQKLLVIVGPTSSGKSALAVALARKLNGEVISADSRQVYRGLDIGTGKITKREMRGVRHHLLNVASPTLTFTAHDFIRKGRDAIQTIAGRGKLPIVAGGTGFYIDALVGRIALPNVPANSELRRRLEAKTAAQLYALLKRKDRRRAKNIDAHNKRRLIRALEVAAALGRVPKNMDGRHLYFDALWLGIDIPASTLKKRIARRLAARMKQGMIAEAMRLHAQGLSYKRMEQLGLEYRYCAHFLRGKISRDKMFVGLNRDIFRYAKRQLSYWKRNNDIKWLDARRIAPLVTRVKKWRFSYAKAS